MQPQPKHRYESNDNRFILILFLSILHELFFAGLLDAAVVDNILDYLREILEEGLNLDVSGDALLERLSVQCTDQLVLPGVVELAQRLGITRFTTSGGVNSSTAVDVIDGLVDNKGKVVVQWATTPLYKVSSMDAVTFAEKFLK